MMKNRKKRTLAIIISAAAILISAAVPVTAAWLNYREGNRILVMPENLASAEAILDVPGFPYGTGRILYSGKEYAFIESRAELMPVIENSLRESGEICDEMIPAYREAHTGLFLAVICAGAAVCLYCIVITLFIRKSITAYLFLAAAFLTAAGCMHWLSVLTLTVL